MKKQYFLTFISFFVLVCLVSCSLCSHTLADKTSLSLQTSSYVLMEATTGTVILNSNEHQKLPPASITKLMTLLLIFESLDDQKINLSDEVTTSDHAASMGGSNVFLEENEVQTVETMIKCICISSANDAAVAMAEHLSGSEEAFVKLMNKKAKKLGMNDTHFENACGLDCPNHVSSAYDIAILARELTIHHPKIFDYSTIWMDSFEHVTRRGRKTFNLSNTNKLLKQYPYATGLKTGSTSKAKYCLCATAKKKSVQLIAVLLGANTTQLRFKEARALLDYGFSNCNIITDKTKKRLPTLKVTGGTKDFLSIISKKSFSYVDTKGQNASNLKTILDLPKVISAPVKKGQYLGTISYYLGEEKIGSMKLYAANSISKLTFLHCLRKLILFLLPI